jgi:hypothetical protein
MTAIVKDFEEDEQNGVWQWFGVTSELLEKARKAVLDIPSRDMAGGPSDSACHSSA